MSVFKKIQSCRGISAMELAVVLALIAIMSTMAVPYLGGWLDHYRTVGSSREVASTLQAARIKAITTNREWRVVIQPSTGTFYMEQQGDNGQWIHEGGSKTLPRGVKFTDAGGNGTSPQLSIAFKPSGKALFTVGARNYIAYSVYITGKSGDRYKITVLSLTGRVKIYAWNGKKWAST